MKFLNVSATCALLGGLIFSPPPGMAVNTITLDSIVNHFPSPMPSHFEDGFIATIRATQISIQADEIWALKIYSETPLMGYSKNISDLQFRENGRSSWQSVAPSLQTIVQGGPGSHVIFIDYRLLLRWATDQPGNYTATVHYVLTTPV